MKQLFKILLAVGVIAFAVSITAVSCGKTPDAGGGNNNNSGGGNSGGDGNGNGGGTPTPTPPDIVVTNVNTTVAKVSGNTILLKLSAWTTEGAMVNTDNLGDAITSPARNTKLYKAFEFTHNKATATSEGMLLVGKGNVANAGAITTSAVATTYPAGAAGNDGIHMARYATTTGSALAGLNIISAFANKTDPANAAAAVANVEPFAFSRTSAATFADQPFFFCRATAPAITAAVAATDKLVGADKADCIIGGTWNSYGGAGNAARRTVWFGAADPFKREIQVAVAAIRTDGKTIANLGLPGATDVAKLGNFTDGISDAEMAAIVAANGPVLFKKFNLKIVNDADFAAGTP